MFIAEFSSTNSEETNLVKVNDDLVQHTQTFNSFAICIQFVIELIEVANIREHDCNVGASLSVQLLRLKWGELYN